MGNSVCCEQRFGQDKGNHILYIHILLGIHTYCIHQYMDTGDVGRLVHLLVIGL